MHQPVKHQRAELLHNNGRSAGIVRHMCHFAKGMVRSDERADCNFSGHHASSRKQKRAGLSRGAAPFEDRARVTLPETATADETLPSVDGGADPAVDAAGERHQHIGVRLTVLGRLLRNDFDRQVAHLEVTRSQWAMIAVVSRVPGATQRTIAEALEMSEASAGRLIDRLCADGLLERRDRRDDRRARAVHLTPAAEPLLHTLAKIARSSEQRMFKGFDQDELLQLGNYLDRLHDNLRRG